MKYDNVMLYVGGKWFCEKASSKMLVLYKKAVRKKFGFRVHVKRITYTLDILIPNNEKLLYIYFF